MARKRVYIILFSILLLAFLAGNLVLPQFLNLPKFPNIPFRLGLDLQGGTHLVYEADLSKVDKGDYASVMQGLRDVIERRVNVFGVQEPLIQTEESSGRHRLVVELAGVKDVKEAIKMIGETPLLEFKEKKTDEEIKAILAQLGLKEEKDVPVQAIGDVLFKNTLLNGKDLKSAQVTFDSNTSQAQVSLQFNDEGAKLFEDITARNVGRPVGIFVDNLPISIPNVQEKITGGKAQITGNFTPAQAKSLASNLNAGALPVPISLVSQQTVGPTLGKVSMEKSLMAGIVGLLAIIFFMVLFYRLPGLLASLALLIYVIFVLAIFKLINVTLTLAGIAGFLLSIGMAVDANILIFARIKEEMMLRNNFSISLAEGFRRAWPSIRDSNLNTLIVSAILFGFSTSFIKGFALTLSLGVVASLFSAIFITRNLLEVFVGTKVEKWKWLWN